MFVIAFSNVPIRAVLNYHLRDYNRNLLGGGRIQNYLINKIVNVYTIDTFLEKNKNYFYLKKK